MAPPKNDTVTSGHCPWSALNPWFDRVLALLIRRDCAGKNRSGRIAGSTHIHRPMAALKKAARQPVDLQPIPPLPLLKTRRAIREAALVRTTSATVFKTVILPAPPNSTNRCPVATLLLTSTRMVT